MIYKILLKVSKSFPEESTKIKMLLFIRLPSFGTKFGLRKHKKTFGSRTGRIDLQLEHFFAGRSYSACRQSSTTRLATCGHAPDGDKDTVIFFNYFLSIDVSLDVF